MTRPVYYVLDERGEARPAESREEYRAGVLAEDDRHVLASCDLGPLGRVSTVFLGVDLALAGRPAIFETTILGGLFDGALWREPTRIRALARQRLTVRRVKRFGLPVPRCAHERELIEMLVESELAVIRAGVEARAKGPGWGVLLQRGADGSPAASVASVEQLCDALRAATLGDSMGEARIGLQLTDDPPAEQVHVLAVREGAAATVTCRATAEVLSAREQRR